MRKDRNLKIVQNFKWFALVSLVVILVGVVLMCTVGLNIGIDFTGGAKVEIELVGEEFAKAETQKDFDDTFVKKVEDQGFNVVDRMQVSILDGGIATYELRLEYEYNGKVVKSEDEQEAFKVALNGIDEDATQNGLRGFLEEEIQSYLGEDSNAYTEDCVRVYLVGATASASLIKSAIWAIIAAIAVILVYIIIRFTLSSGIAAVIALAHDVLVMIAITAMCQISVNSTFIAAAITIIGYSINATIVIFDKIRECTKSTAFVGKTDEEIANYAIKHSMVKILLSTITTLIMVVALVIVSVSAIREFILPIIFGLIAGTYSSICLSPSVWVKLRKIGAKIQKSKKA